MYISKNVRIKLTEEEKRTLRAAASICENLRKALGEAVEEYNLDIAEIREKLLLIAGNNYEYVDEDVLIH